MPIFEYFCNDCKQKSEIIVFKSTDTAICPRCGSKSLTRLVSATSSLTGQPGKNLPGKGDTACCGSSPGMAAGCAGPGSCCGKVYK